MIGVSLAIMIAITLLSLIIGNDFVSGVVEVGVDNDALVDGVSSTFQVLEESLLFQVDTSTLILAGIALLGTVIGVAAITGISVVGSGLNPQSAKIIILLVAFIGLWTVLSILSFNLISQIEVFGSVIYIALTLAYTYGVLKKIAGGGE
jgi:hypothetical protein